MIPAWAGDYVGLPYRDKGRDRAGADCWGGARMVLAEVFGQHLPDYSDAYTTAEDRHSVAAAVEAGLADGWIRVEQPRAGDLLTISIAGRPWHCGVMVNPLQFLHWPPPDKQGRQLLACVERLDSPHWSARKKEFHRYG